MSSPRWEVEGRDWPLRAHSRFVEAGGLRWHVQQLGEGPPLLLLHGTGAATHSWREVAPRLADDFSVLALDLPRHGFTTGRLRGGSTLPNVAGAVGALLDQLDVEPAMIAGHSAGVAIAAQMALEGRHGGALVGFNPALLPFPGLAARIFPAFAKLLFLNPVAPSLFARIARVPGETGRFLYRSTGSRIDADGIESYRRLMGTSDHCAGALAMMADWDLDRLEGDLPRIANPVLLVHGERDSAIPAFAVRRAADLIPNARHEEMAGLGHLAHEERPERAAGLVRAFAEECGLLPLKQGR